MLEHYGIFPGEKVDIHVQMSRLVSLAYCIDFFPFSPLLLIFISFLLLVPPLFV